VEIPQKQSNQKLEPELLGPSNPLHCTGSRKSSINKVTEKTPLATSAGFPHDTPFHLIWLASNSPNLKLLRALNIACDAIPPRPEHQHRTSGSFLLDKVVAAPSGETFGDERL
jgi:hypothetical protein